jgi:hypothetical protein
MLRRIGLMPLADAPQSISLSYSPHSQLRLGLFSGFERSLSTFFRTWEIL